MKYYRIWKDITNVLRIQTPTPITIGRLLVKKQAMIDEFNTHTVSLMEDFLEIQKNDPDTPADIKKEIVKFQKK